MLLQVTSRQARFYKYWNKFHALKGKVFDTDKFMWLQGEDLQCRVSTSLISLFFLQKSCYGNFSPNSQLGNEMSGKPLVVPYSIFRFPLPFIWAYPSSDCFAAMAFAQYYKATKENWAKQLALQVCIDQNFTNNAADLREYRKA